MHERQSQEDKVRGRQEEKGEKHKRAEVQAERTRCVRKSNRKTGGKRQRGERAVHNELCPTFTKAALNHALLGSAHSQHSQDPHTFSLIYTHCTCNPPVHSPQWDKRA